MTDKIKVPRWLDGFEQEARKHAESDPFHHDALRLVTLLREAAQPRPSDEELRRDAVKRAARMAELNRMLREGGWHIESIREFRRELIALEDEALAAEKREG